MIKGTPLLFLIILFISVGTAHAQTYQTPPPTTAPSGGGGLTDTLKTLAHFATHPTEALINGFKLVLVEALGLEQGTGQTPSDKSILYYLYLPVSPDTYKICCGPGTMEDLANEFKGYAYFFWGVMVLMTGIFASTAIGNPQKEAQAKDAATDIVIAFILINTSLFLYQTLADAFKDLTLSALSSTDSNIIAKEFIAGAFGVFTWIMLAIGISIVSIIFMLQNMILVYGAAVFPVLLAGVFFPIGFIKAISRFGITVLIVNMGIPFFYAMSIRIYDYIVNNSIIPHGGLGPALMLGCLLGMIILVAGGLLLILSTTVGRVGSGAAVSAATGNPLPLAQAVGQGTMTRSVMSAGSRSKRFSSPISEVGK